jgi:CRP-like cAMP-binding protein
MSNFNESLKEILKSTSKDKIKQIAYTKDSLKEFSSDFIQILNLKENTIFIDRYTELEYIYILLDGVTYVVNYTLEGRRVIADTFTESQIFGLIEAINHDSKYRGTVVTLSKALLVKVNKNKFLEAINSDLEISAYIIKYLAYFSTHSMQVSEYKTAISSYENLIIYLYNKTLGKKLPEKINDNKSFIADSLQINKRTLYRYLNKLQEEGSITRERQNIVITEKNFKKLEILMKSIND